jgi:hypothetical protein
MFYVEYQNLRKEWKMEIFETYSEMKAFIRNLSTTCTNVKEGWKAK